MKTMKGPGLFLAQFAGDAAPFNSLEAIADWAADLGYKGLQIPTFDGRLFDLDQAAASKGYCDDIKGMLADKDLAVTELSTHLQGQLVAVHPAFNEAFDAFAPETVHGNPDARTEWAVDQMKKAAVASRHFGLDASVSFPGALAWPYVYPWPQRPAGLIDTAFEELAKRWKPILDVYDEHGVDVCYEIHPGEDVFDGATFEMFLDALDGHARCCINYDPSHFVLQQLDYLAFIDIYHERIKAFHVKDAEF
ncbi:sugar phosphate isomerase/epimerase, partial [Roseibium sp.]